jgi:S-adenosylmethionine-diacylgycerolhomoserine-N-methlytransferase
VAADATVWRPPQLVDGVLCAYSLTMIPDWFAAVDNAITMLRPGGTLAVVDFHVPRGSGAGRTFWPWWFGHDGVHPNADLLPYLHHRLRALRVVEGRAQLPYLPGLRVPWFRFVGSKAP